MYSPVQEVPSTPLLNLRNTRVSAEAQTPDAVVPDTYSQSSQDESYSVPGTPRALAVPLTPLAPVARSIIRCTATSSGRRYVYDPSFRQRSPLVGTCANEQVVPCTPGSLKLEAFSTPDTPSRPAAHKRPRHMAFTSTLGSDFRDHTPVRTSPLLFSSEARLGSMPSNGPFEASLSGMTPSGAADEVYESRDLNASHDHLRALFSVSTPHCGNRGGGGAISRSRKRKRPLRETVARARRSPADISNGNTRGHEGDRTQDFLDII
ncbi:uncharacterized protein LOC127874755 [Dreissena polymorpha]|uniref:Uncharacterized protein n=1 Tax=Dreissena polymorpha TaxID=45954 RepID=A0A9D4L432_DREPO|nr:uncharacterized protein LOC127874755 [Dreissena polymorpha]XP_052275308.1 uncharacterized protein LOC127874755 [Dreissena polymorpha]KAH3851393.1 hypothetical protein DPMN_093873 [Dreissena polymorpha]